MKLKDFVNLTLNKRNNQTSFHLKKREMKREGININDILDVDLYKKLKEFKKG